jgi:predicted ABC-type ATPase
MILYFALSSGAFGSGKSHVLTWLDHHGYFPLHSFVVVDPDHLREKLPETAEYIRRDASTAGYMTQKEVGYISEVIILKALLEGKNVIVDGSLKDHEWYCQYMLQLRNTFPQLKLAIIHVATSLETAVSRAARRGHETGRVVPVEAIKDQLVSIPQSLELLKSYVTYYCTFRNDDIPKLVISSTGEATLSSFKAVWEMSCQDNDNTDVCPDNLITWKKNNYYRLWVSTPKEYCKLNCSL